MELDLEDRVVVELIRDSVSDVLAVQPTK